MFKAYQLALLSLAGAGLLAFIQQFLSAFFKNVKAKGTPGLPLAEGHEDLNWRAERAFYNTLENLPIFAIFVVVAILAKASTAINYLALGFLIARILHMAVYYANVQNARSLCWFLGLICSVSIGVMGLIALF